MDEETAIPLERGPGETVGHGQTQDHKEGQRRQQNAGQYDLGATCLLAAPCEPVTFSSLCYPPLTLLATRRIVEIPLGS